VVGVVAGALVVLVAQHDVEVGRVVVEVVVLVVDVAFAAGWCELEHAVAASSSATLHRTLARRADDGGTSSSSRTVVATPAHPRRDRRWT
jgi:hypothetical protein